MFLLLKGTTVIWQHQQPLQTGSLQDQLYKERLHLCQQRMSASPSKSNSLGELFCEAVSDRIRYILISSGLPESVLSDQAASRPTARANAQPATPLAAQTAASPAGEAEVEPATQPVAQPASRSEGSAAGQPASRPEGDAEALPVTQAAAQAVKGCSTAIGSHSITACRHVQQLLSRCRALQQLCQMAINSLTNQQRIHTPPVSRSGESALYTASDEDSPGHGQQQAGQGFTGMLARANAAATNCSTDRHALDTSCCTVPAKALHR